VLKDDSPLTRNGREYSQHELDFFRQAAQRIAVDLDPELRKRLDSGQADLKLWQTVRSSVGRRSVFTITGRLRAQASFSSARNNVFQGPAADGAILGMWQIWRAGYKIVSFVHDQIVVESPADGLVHQRMAEIESMMKRGMEAVVPGMRVGVESVISQSLSKKELDPRYTGGSVIGSSHEIGSSVSLTQGIQGANPVAVGLAPSPELCVHS